MNIQDHVIYTRREWENLPVFVNILNFFKTRSIKNIIDIGANVGEVSKVFLEKFNTIEKCYLFEPQIDNYNFIKNRFSEDSRVESYNCGIYYGKSESNLYRQDTNVGGFSIQQNVIKENEIVQLKTLEYFNFKDIDFVKIDIEGSEYNVIQNSESIKTIPYILVEYHTLGICLDGKSPKEYFIEFSDTYLNNYRLIDHSPDYIQCFFERKF